MRIEKNKIESNYFFLYPSFRLVKGYKRSIIIDTEYAKLNEIPFELFDILNNFNKSKMSTVIEGYEEDDKIILLQYFEQLHNEGILYLTEDEADIKNIKKTSDKWEIPHNILNGIIDIDIHSKSEVIDRLNSLVVLKVPNVELRFFCDIGIEELELCLNQSLKTNINSITIYLPYIKNSDKVDYSKIMKKHLRIVDIFVYSSPYEKKLEFHGGLSRILYLKKDLGDIRNCGNVNQGYFVSTMEFIRESQSCNTCLNRKISVDVNGEIKNCPSMQKSYGNIKNTTLKEALTKEGFKDLWHIKKDDVEVCKDCEYRYICPDCRAYLESPDNSYSKPLKCGYDPYKGIWEDWSTHPLKQKAIKHYKMNDIATNNIPID